MKGFLLVVLACFLWATDTLFRYPLLSKNLSATNLVFLEHSLLLIVSLFVIIQSRKVFWAAKLSDLFYFFILGAFGSAFATVAFTKAFTLINPSIVILLQKLQPLWAIFFAHLWLKESLSKKFLLWSVVGLAGTFLISYPSIAKGLSQIDSWSDLLMKESWIGLGLSLFAVISWGSATVIGKKMTTQGYGAKEMMAARFFMGWLALLPFQTAFVQVEFKISLMGNLLMMVLLSGILGMYSYYNGLKRISAKLCALAELFFPFAAVIVNWIFLGQGLEAVEIAGGAVLISSVAIIQWKHY
jgi:drug/metabolite transporter (DMT)-like permease